MPELPRYENRAGPQRQQPYAPRDYGDVIGQGVANLGQGLSALGQAFADTRKKVESSQAAIELGHAQNLVREHLNDFQLQLNEDPEFMLYEEKYREAAEAITKDIPETIKTQEAKDKFNLWWEGTSEEIRFKIAQLSQKKNLEWQVGSLEESVNGIVDRTDEYAIDDLKSLLEGAKNNGLITNDKYLAILEESKGKIYENRVKKTSIAMGMIEGREWVLNGQFSPEAERYVSRDKRVEIADKLYTQWTRQKTIEAEQQSKAREQENEKSFTDFLNPEISLTDEEIDTEYPNLTVSDKEHLIDLYNGKRATGLFRLGTREIVDGKMSEKRLREIGDMGLEEEKEQQLRNIWDKWKSDREAGRKAAVPKSDPLSLDALISMLMDWHVDYHEIEDYIKREVADGKILSVDALKYRDYALNKKKPSELLTAETTISGFFNEIAKDQWGDKKTETFVNAGKIKQIIVEEYFEGTLAEEGIIPRTKELLRPFNRNLLQQIFGGPAEPPTKRESEKEPQKKKQSDYGLLLKKGSTGAELWRKGNIFYRKLPNGTWERMDEQGKWVTE